MLRICGCGRPSTRGSRPDTPEGVRAHLTECGAASSSPNNRWILSTNTDMIFVPRGARSLSGAAEALEGGFYHLPRFEVPEYLWETLNRCDPGGVIALVARWGWSLHLNEVVTGLPTNRYDGPGDFQFGLREDLFRVHGFDERMLIGWHVDSNIAARMSLLYGRPDTMVEHFFGYHCDHTRQVTPAHSQNRTENDWRVYVTQVKQAEIPSQAETWGLAGEHVEEVHLTIGARVYLHALHKAVGEPMRELSTVALAGSSYDVSATIRVTSCRSCLMQLLPIHAV